MKSVTVLPGTMRAAQVSSIGHAEKVLSVSPSVPLPPAPTEGQITIKVHACSLSPNDIHILTGTADFVKKPKTFPYIPGGDIAGIVTAVPLTSEGAYAVGDRVVVTSSCIPLDGMAQYANVNVNLVRRLPNRLSFTEGAALANSAVTAIQAVDAAAVTKNDSVLVLGGSGGVGTAVIQLLHERNVSSITVTSTDTPLMKSLGAHTVIDYTMTKWWQSPEIQSRAPFDVIIDCAEGVTAWQRARRDHLVKNGGKGGRFIAVVWNEWQFEIHNVFHIFGHVGPVVMRMMSACMNKTANPGYKGVFPGPKPDDLQRVMEMAERGHIRAVIDGEIAHPFTTDGVREAFTKMERRVAHGKVVVEISHI